MRQVRLLCLGLLGLCVATPVAARNDVYHLQIAQAIKSPEANGRFDNFVLLFGDQPASGYTTLGEHLASERSHFHGRTEEQACQANFLEALGELKKDSIDAGGDAVIGIISYYRDVAFSSTTEYECHAGANGVFVWLKGAYAKAR